MEEVKEQYDFIFMDCVPYSSLADARIVARLADVTLYVMRAGRVKKRDLIGLQKIWKNGELEAHGHRPVRRGAPWPLFPRVCRVQKPGHLLPVRGKIIRFRSPSYAAFPSESPVPGGIPVRGGAEKVLSGLVRGLDRERFDVTVCTVVDCGPYREEVGKYAHYRTIVGGRGWLYRLKYALVYRFLPAGWIYKWCIAGDYDVEAAFTEGFPTRLLAAAPEGKARRLAWVHVDLEARPWTQGLVFRSLEEERKAYARFQTVAHVSQTVREAFERRFGAHAGSVVLHNPVDRDAVRSGLFAEEVPEKSVSALFPWGVWKNRRALTG